MIRTETVQLKSIPAKAYRQKLPAGGSGVVIMRKNSAQPGIASISKKTGEAIPAANTPADLFPLEAFQEAITLTAGLPYKKRRAVSEAEKKLDKEPKSKEAAEVEVVINSDEYQKIVETYTNKKGALSYDLLNKDMIRFAHNSSKVREMIAEKESVKTIRTYIVGTKFRNITGNTELTDKQVQKMTDLLDEVSPKGVFKELNDELRKKLKK